MALWSDVIDPATLTGYTRKHITELDSTGLARFLPNSFHKKIVIGFNRSDNGLVEAAEFRSYDAEIEIGEAKGGSKVYLELPALGQKFPVSEYDQLRLRDAGDAEVRAEVLGSAKKVAKAIMDRMEYQRGQVLTTGAVVVDQARFALNESFGRSAEMDVTIPALWSNPTADALQQLRDLIDAYKLKNDEAPGALLMSTKALMALGRLDIFKSSTTNPRPASPDELRNILDSYDIPRIETYDRKVKLRGKGIQRTTPEDRIFFLPAAGGANDAGSTQLGGSFWGQTLTSSELSWGIEASARPGVVTGAYRNEKPPVRAEVIGDAIGMPVLANPDLAMVAKVL